MRFPRIKTEPDCSGAYYHLISRIVGGEFLLADVEKEVLRKLIWRVGERLGIEILTYAVMSNHVHVIVYAPKREHLSDRELLRRHALLHSSICVRGQRHLAALEAMLQANGTEADEWRQAEMQKMSDISVYMKLLKQRFSIWYNRSRDRFGTLWAERFKSVLLESGRAVERSMLYVDLNPFRANLCRDPKDYRFCGYAEAVAGCERAQTGIATALGGPTSWAEAQALYRLKLCAVIEQTPNATPDVRNLSRAEVLRCRCRYLTNGAVLGSKVFVLEQIVRFRSLTGCGQLTEPRLYADFDPHLATMRKMTPGLMPA